jgi:hypothetical protein
MLIGEALSVSEVEQHLKEAKEVLSLPLGENVSVYPFRGTADATRCGLHRFHNSSPFLRTSSFTDFLILPPNPKSQNLVARICFLGLRSVVAGGCRVKSGELPRSGAGGEKGCQELKEGGEEWKRDWGEETDDGNDDDDDSDDGEEEEGVGGVLFADWVEMAHDDEDEDVGGSLSSSLVGVGRSSDVPQGLSNMSHPCRSDPLSSWWVKSGHVPSKCNWGLVG